MKKDKEWLLDEIERITDEYSNHSFFTNYARYMILEIEEAVNQLDELEVLSQKWIDEHKEFNGIRDDYVWVDDLQNLLVPEQNEVDRAYKDGYEKGKEHAVEKQKRRA